MRVGDVDVNSILPDDTCVNAIVVSEDIAPNSAVISVLDDTYTVRLLSLAVSVSVPAV